MGHQPPGSWGWSMLQGDDKSIWWLGQHAVLGGWTLTAWALGGCEGSWDSPGSAAPCLQLGCRAAIKAAGSSCSEPAAVPLLMGESAKRGGFVAAWSQAAPHSPARPRALLGMFLSPQAGLCSSLVCSSCQAWPHCHWPPQGCYPMASFSGLLKPRCCGLLQPSQLWGC